MIVIGQTPQLPRAFGIATDRGGQVLGSWLESMCHERLRRCDAGRIDTIRRTRITRRATHDMHMAIARKPRHVESKLGVDHAVNGLPATRASWFHILAPRTKILAYIQRNANAAARTFGSIQ